MDIKVNNKEIIGLLKEIDNEYVMGLSDQMRKPTKYIIRALDILLKDKG